MRKNAREHYIALLGLGVATGYTVAVFWESQAEACALLLASLLVSLRTLGKPGAWLPLLLLGHALALADALLVHAGVKTYHRPWAWGVPLWLPYLWANCCALVRLA